MNAKKGKILWSLCIGFTFLTTACIISVDGTDTRSNIGSSSTSGVTTTNIVVITTNSAIVTNESYFTNSVYYTNGSYVTNDNYYTNDNYFTNDNFYTNDHYVTNDYYHTNIVTNLIEGYCNVTLTTPYDGQYVDGQFYVNGSATSPGSLETVVIFFETATGGNVYVSTGSIFENTFNASVNVSREGSYNVWAAVWDVYGATGNSDKVRITADWTPPVLTVVNPAQGEVTLTVGQDFQMNGLAVDAYAGLEGVYAQTDLYAPEKISSQTNWNFQTTLPEGTHTVKVYAKDNAGHVTLNQTYTVNVVR